MHWSIEFTLLLAVYGIGVSGAVSSEDWKVQEWDVIVVGAGPAGIIGKHISTVMISCLIFTNMRIVADKMSAAGLATLLIEGGGESYGITGGDLDSRRPVSKKS